MPLSRQYIFIDANTGKILETFNRIHQSDEVGTAETIYNGTVSITTDSYSGSYRLRETGRGAGIETMTLIRERFMLLLLILLMMIIIGMPP